MQTLSATLLVLLAASTAAQLPNCPPLWAGSGQYCYQFFKVGLPWKEANDFCSRFSSCADGSPATLAKLASAQDDFRLESYLAPKGNPSPPNSWVGLGDPFGTGTITWPDGTTPQSNNYNNFDPQAGRNGNCVVKDTRTNRWTFAPCTQANSFVCQMARGQARDQQPPNPGGPGGPPRPV